MSTNYVLFSGLLLLKNGIIYNKWSHNKLPDDIKLKAPLNGTSIGQVASNNDCIEMTIAISVFILPLGIIAIIDFMKYRNRKKRIKAL